MPVRHVVIVAFDGIQPLDAVGPHEVFSGATRVLAASGRPGWLPGHPGLGATAAPSRSESGLELGTVPLPDPDERDRHPDPAGRERLQGGAPPTRRCAHGSGPPRPDAAGWPRSARAPTWLPRPACSRAAGSPPTGPAADELRRAYPGTDGRCRPHLHPGRQVLVQRRGDGGHRPVPGPGAGRPRGRPWPRRWPAGWSCSCTVPGARPSSPRRSGCRGPSARPSGPCSRWSRRRPDGDHRVPALAAAAAMSVRHFARVFTDRGGRDAGPLRRAGPPRGGPPRARDHHRHPGRASPRAVGSARPRSLRRVFHRRLGVSPDAYRRRFFTTPTSNATREDTRMTDHLAGRHPAVRPVHRPRCGRALRGAPAHPHPRHHLRRAPPRRGAHRERHARA